jgi:hypothetical protein
MYKQVLIIRMCCSEPNIVNNPAVDRSILGCGPSESKTKNKPAGSRLSTRRRRINTIYTFCSIRGRVDAPELDDVRLVTRKVQQHTVNNEVNRTEIETPSSKTAAQQSMCNSRFSKSHQMLKECN